MGAVAFAFSLCIVAALGIVEIGSPFSVGSVGVGYTLAIPDGSGNIFLASRPEGTGQTVISKVPISADGALSLGVSGEVSLLANKGYATSGCISTHGSSPSLYLGLSTTGFVARVPLTLTEVEYLDATNTTLWNGGSPLEFSSAVCQGQYVYFGTQSTSVTNTIVRLDTENTDHSSRFASLSTALAPGDFTFGASWGSDVLFVMEKDGDSPMAFYIVNGGSQLSLKAVIPALDVSGFDTLSGIAPDFASSQVYAANSNGNARVAVFDLSQSSHALVTQSIELSTEGMSPITSFSVDFEAHYAYATVGDCASGVAVVATRLVPTLTQSVFLVSDPTVYNCESAGVPTTSILIKHTENTSRQVLALTKVDSGEGKIVPLVVFSADSCPENCHSADKHGYCAGGQCFCETAFTGPVCDARAACGGNSCSGKGVCKEDGTCECELGFAGVDCAFSVPCPLECSSHGSCSGSLCVCDEGFTGLACELQTTGCESLNQCNGHGKCLYGRPFGSCDCDEGFTGPDCSKVDLSCPGNCTGHGSCVGGNCVCNDQWTGSDCSRMIPTCPNNCSARGQCDHGLCHCLPGFQGEDCSVVDGGVCPNGCSGHGTCVSGICHCASGFLGFDCSHMESALHMANVAILVAGENVATSSFFIPSTNEVVFCVASTPGKCIAFNSESLVRTRTVDLVPPTTSPNSTSLLIQMSSSKELNSLVPESIAMLETGAPQGPAPVSVAVTDTVAGFAVVGTRANEGTMHGELIKISTANLQPSGKLTLSDDTGRGVTAGIRASDGSMFFASGSSPAMIYKISPQLEVVSRSNPADGPDGEINVLLFDGSRYLIAASEGKATIFEVVGDQISKSAVIHPIEIPQAFGVITAGFIESISSSSAVAFLGTSSSPAAVVKVTISSSGSTVESLRLRVGENHISSVVRREDISYWGLGSDGTSCGVAKLVVSAFREQESVSVPSCSSNLVSASIAEDGRFAFFGSAASPAHVFSLRLFSRTSCPSDCSSQGVCVDGTCSCEPGFLGDACQIAQPVCANNCSQAGQCLNGTCHCDAGHFGIDCSVIEICADLCQNGKCVGANNNWPCECESEAWDGTYCSERTVYCPRECSGNGQCDHGKCICAIGYTGDDCSRESFPSVTERSCSMDADCGSHGVCHITRGSGTGNCGCAQGWTGDDCDIDMSIRDTLEPSKLSGGMLALIVIGALAVGAVVTVSLLKRGGVPAPAPSAKPAPNASRVPTTTGYTRFPHPAHRLVK